MVSGFPDEEAATQVLTGHVSGHPVGDGEVLPSGTQLGHYLLQELLGKGGMGEVYHAEQLHPVRRTVALKLLRGSRVQASHLAYFEVERQILAQMHHPSIAQIYDAGTVADGVPYFAMEYIEGRSVTQYCVAHGMPSRDRIELFIRICEGVQHAHNKGVIHRDLKPGNILVVEVDGRAWPKIIDFGIATATSRAIGSEAAEFAGTPDYMSPEQVIDPQAMLDTRCDVYALGVLLHELLAGHRPIQPAPASAGTLPTELAAIIAKATRRERSERYDTVAELAEDLRRYLQDRPVSALPRSRRYAWRKFLRRHRFGLAAGMAVVVAVLGGLAFAVHGLVQAERQRVIAEQRSAELQKVVAFQQSMLEGLDIESMGQAMSHGLVGQMERLQPGQGAGLARDLQQLDTTELARQLLDDNLLARASLAVSQDFADQPALAAELDESIARVQARLGLDEAAARSYHALADYHRQADGSASVATLRARLGQANALFNLARYPQVRELLDPALVDADRLPSSDPTRVGLELLNIQLQAARGERELARQLATTLHQRLAATAPTAPLTLEALHEVARRERELGEIKPARTRMEEVLSVRQQVLGPSHPDTLAAMGELAILRIMTGEKEQALALQRELARRQIARLGGEHPTSLHARATLATMLVDAGHAEEAIPQLQAVLEAQRRILGDEHPRSLRTRLNLATAYARVGQFDKSLALEEAVIEARTRVLGAEHPDTISILVNHAATLLNDGQVEASLALLDTVLPQARRILGDQHPQARAAMQIQAHAALEKGDTQAALAGYGALFALLEKLYGSDDLQTRQAAWNMVREFDEAGHPELAADVRAKYLAPLLAAAPATLDAGSAALASTIRSSGG